MSMRKQERLAREYAVLYHLPDLEAGVAELARVLRPGGRLVGIHNRDRHMEELSSRLRPEAAEEVDYVAENAQ